MKKKAMVHQKKRRYFLTFPIQFSLNPTWKTSFDVVLIENIHWIHIVFSLCVCVCVCVCLDKDIFWFWQCLRRYLNHSFPMFQHYLAIASEYLTLYAPSPQNGQTHSKKSSVNCRPIVWACLAILWGWS